MTARRRHHIDAGDGITAHACGTGPLNDRDRQALATIARAAVARHEADQAATPSTVQLALHNLAVTVEGQHWRTRGPGRTTGRIAEEAGVRIADVSCCFQQSPRLRARAANALAVWAGW